MDWLPAASEQLPEAAAGLRASLPGRLTRVTNWLVLYVEMEEKKNPWAFLEFKRALGFLRGTEEQHLESHQFLTFYGW